LLIDQLDGLFGDGCASGLFREVAAGISKKFFTRLFRSAGFTREPHRRLVMAPPRELPLATGATCAGPSA
jgi:hypothetical protein